MHTFWTLLKELRFVVGDLQRLLSIDLEVTPVTKAFVSWAKGSIDQAAAAGLPLPPHCP